ncbi:MAG: hypothetical protein SP1CHLAM54_10760 [Chlamydiia bacterium]|nr:hypothetical protein [Chlamydiia bacterium]MCH9615981.1 hypothetical protein [Chlamydiia bacterium]MCH9628616.1 hypothetical protein [Chlamydiia bacterium]
MISAAHSAALGRHLVETFETIKTGLGKAARALGKRVRRSTNPVLKAPPVTRTLSLMERLQILREATTVPTSPPTSSTAMPKSLSPPPPPLPQVTPATPRTTAKLEAEFYEERSTSLPTTQLTVKQLRAKYFANALQIQRHRFLKENPGRAFDEIQAAIDLAEKLREVDNRLERFGNPPTENPESKAYHLKPGTPADIAAQIEEERRDLLRKKRGLRGAFQERATPLLPYLAGQPTKLPPLSPRTIAQAHKALEKHRKSQCKK